MPALQGDTGLGLFPSSHDPTKELGAAPAQCDNARRGLLWVPSFNQVNELPRALSVRRPPDPGGAGAVFVEDDHEANHRGHRLGGGSRSVDDGPTDARSVVNLMTTTKPTIPPTTPSWPQEASPRTHELVNNITALVLIAHSRR